MSFDSWFTDRKTVDTQLEYQGIIGSAQNNDSPKYLIVAHQPAASVGVPNKLSKVAHFDSLNVRENRVDIDGARYPRDGVSIEYTSKDYLDQIRDRKMFCTKYVGEELLNPFIGYTDIKNKHLIQVIDLRLQVDFFNPNEIQLFEKHRGISYIHRKT